MKDMFMSQTGFWTAFTIIFILVLMAWFIYKMYKLSGQKPPLSNEDQNKQ